MEKAGKLLDLAAATAPVWQTECRWEAMSCLRCYLTDYDYLHLAHKGPDMLFYPVSVGVPDGLKGIDLCLFYLNVLWLENQIMAGFGDDALEPLWSRLPVDTLNQCEQAVLNGIGKMMISASVDAPVFTETEHEELRSLFAAHSVREIVHHAGLQLCRQLHLTENASAYLCNTAAQMVPWLEMALRQDNLSSLFL